MGSSIAGANHSIGYDQVFQLASGAEYEDDLILNGPFGDMRGKTWGADGHEMHGFSGLPVGTITYSQRNDVNVCMFRHATKPFFLWEKVDFSPTHSDLSGKHIKEVTCTFRLLSTNSISRFPG